MLVSEFDYELPEELIARQPAAQRDASRMLRLERTSGTAEDRMFREFPALLRAGDLLVMNDTRVFPARLFGRRSGERAQAVSPRNPAAKEFLQGRVEVLLTRQLDGGEWQALVRPGRKISVGERLTFGEGRESLHAEVTARGEFGERRLRFEAGAGGEFFERLERLGHVPLPPYIDRPDAEADRERYQTVYAGPERGSSAAPTAGLHFTRAVLDEIRERGVETATVTLHVGLGTFQPVRNARVEDNKLHSEHYRIPKETAEKIARARKEGRRTVAVGTTTVRTLETAAAKNPAGVVETGEGETELFIYPGFKFKVVDALLTNFHLPQSTLLMLVCAFAGREPTLAAYRHAVKERYRFFSYGDCMWVE